MTQKDKELLLVDLCARSPYKPKALVNGHLATILGIDENIVIVCIDGNDYKDEIVVSADDSSDDVKPYLRPMSRMTEEESAELSNIINEWFDKELFYLTEEPFLEYALSKINYSISPQLFDWFNKHHFDYRGLIEKGLAIEAPEGMYN